MNEHSSYGQAVMMKWTAQHETTTAVSNVDSAVGAPAHVATLRTQGELIRGV